MNRTLIVAKIRPDAQDEVTRIWTESDATSLPYDVGVRERSLYRLRDLYIQMIDFDSPVEVAMAKVQQQPGFREISERLRPFISPYLPDWRSPKDAMPSRFYHWTATA
jgi:cyclase